VRRGTACVLLLLAMALAAGCGSGSAKQDAARAARARAAARLHAKRMVAGRRLFAKNCASCHTLAGRVAHPTFIESPIPNLDEVKPRVAYVVSRAETGGFDMPGFQGQLAREDIAAVATYVAEASGGRIADVGREDGATLSLGGQMFSQHCQRCHGIGGQKATNKPPPPYPGTDFNLVKPSQQMVMERARRGIPGEMPSFRGKLTPAQLHALAVYVTATAGR
jgi:cytochrome c oxidase cbb3-type subunit III